MANYVFISPFSRACDNMALDEYLLDHVLPDDLILLFYVNENAVIIGKNQNPWKECDRNAMDRDGVELARRISGGGAVYHDGGNLNYSFIAGENRYDPGAFQDLILSCLKEEGVPCEASGRNDLVVCGKKISGTAFAVRHGKHLHHGTLLICSDLTRLGKYLTVDPGKIRSKGIDSVRSRVADLVEFKPELTVPGMRASLCRAFEKRYGAVVSLPFSDAERIALESYRARHVSWEWRIGNTPGFDLAWSERFPWGGVELYLILEKGVIREARAFSDAMDTSLCDDLERTLMNLPLDRGDVSKAAEALGGAGGEALLLFSRSI